MASESESDAGIPSLPPRKKASGQNGTAAQQSNGNDVNEQASQTRREQGLNGRHDSGESNSEASSDAANGSEDDDTSHTSIGEQAGSKVDVKTAAAPVQKGGKIQKALEGQRGDTQLTRQERRKASGDRPRLDEETQQNEAMALQPRREGNQAGRESTMARQGEQRQVQGSGGKDTLRLRLDLNLDIELELKAQIKGDITLALLQ